MSSSVLTWGADPASTPLLASERLRELERSHHAMWNYLTYRDAIAIVGLDAAELYPGGTTRLDPASWADLGWLTCFAGPPPSAVVAMRDAVTAEHLNQYSPDLIEPLRNAAAGVIGRSRDDGFEVVGTEGAQAGIALSLMAVAGPGDEVILSDPGYFHVPSAIIAAGAVPVTVPIDASNDYRLDPDVVAAAITPRTRAIVIVDPLNPYGTVQTTDELAALARLADEHGLLLIHDVTHRSIVIDPTVPFATLPALRFTENAVATFSVSHCFGMAGARIGFLGGPSRLMRSCLRLKAALTRLNTSLIAQHGALAALEDERYLARAQGVVRANLAHLRAMLPEAIAEAAAGRWREPVAALLESKGTPRAIDLAATVRSGL
jgi:aspartate/methionine/tyrosine aminotransferase